MRIGAALAAALLAIAAGCAPRSTEHEAGSGLRTFEAGTGSLPVVLLHGYGATPRD